MEMEFLAFLSGVLVGAAVMFLPAFSVNHKSEWYKNGFWDGYEEGKKEAKGKNKSGRPPGRNHKRPVMLSASRKPLDGDGMK